MLEVESFRDEIINADEARSQGLKYLPHWPPVNIDFEDIIYTVENATESKYLLLHQNSFKRISQRRFDDSFIQLSKYIDTFIKSDEN